MYYALLLLLVKVAVVEPKGLEIISIYKKKLFWGQHNEAPQLCFGFRLIKPAGASGNYLTSWPVDLILYHLVLFSVFYILL